MIIKEIHLKNFRIYKGDNPIILETTKDKNIVVVSGKNGFGKTTFLMSLVWCMYGRQMEQVDDLYQKEIQDQGGYAKYIANSLNRLAKSEGESTFSVSITFSDVSIPEITCEELKITRTYSTIGANPEVVEILIDGHENELANEVGPEIFIRDFIMPLAIAKFFFFDAEKIVTLAEINTPEQRKKLSKAYSEVLGIQKYEDLKSELVALQQRLRAESASKTERLRLDQLKLSVQQAETLIEENEARIQEEREAIAEKRSEANKIQEKLIRQGNIISIEELKKLREREESLNTKVDELNQELKASFEIIPLAIAGENLLDVSEQLEDEKSFKNAKFNNEKASEVTHKIINDLIKEPKPESLVIDWQVEDFYKHTIEKLIKEHFFSEAQEFSEDFEMLHDFSEMERNELLELMGRLRLSFKESFRRISGDYTQARNELTSIRKQIRAGEEHQEDPIIEEDRKKKEELEKQILHHEEVISGLDREIGEKRNEIIQSNKEIAKITEKLNVSDRNREKFETAERLIKELQAFIAKFKEAKKKSLEDEIHKGLSTLMHKKGFVDKVVVEILGEDIDINLFNKRNEEINKDSLSKGEQQMYATALLKGLVEESDIEFPVFIDSPMQKFDVDHALNIVKFFYPTVSDQVVIFPLVKKEMTEEEYEILEPSVSKCYLIHNVEHDWSKFKPVKSKNLFSEFEEMNSNAI